MLQWLKETDYPGTTIDDIAEGYSDETLEAHRNEYRVLTGEEADEAVKDYIKETVWAFNYSFLSYHSEAISEIGEDGFKCIQAQCERANKAVLAMIDDFQHFVDDAILADGRGHFLSSFDGEENETNINNQLFYIYRTD